MTTINSKAVARASAVLLSVGLVASCAAAEPDTAAPAPTDSNSSAVTVDEIKVGLVFPTSGNFAALGTDQMNGVKLAIDWANANGGINGVPIIVVEADTQSDPAAGATAAQRLIDQDEVDILIGSYSSGISQALLPVAERNDVILWEVGAVSPTINADGYSNFLRTVGGSMTYARADIDFIKDFLAPELGVDAADLKIAVGHEDGAFGTSVADAIVELAAAEGLNVVTRETWPANSTDLTPVILRLKEAAPDVMLVTPIVADAFLFWEAARTQDFNVSAIIGSAGFGSSGFVERFGVDGVEGVFDVEAPAVEYMNSEGMQPEVRALLDEWRETFKADYGRPCLIHCGDGLGGGYVLVSDVLPRALEMFGNVDADSILSAAAETDIPDGGTPQGFGARFVAAGTPGTGGDNEAARSFIMQWQAGELKVVWPSTLAVGEPIFPMPVWSDR